MYIKRVQVHRGRNTYSYLKLVQSYREGGRVRQRVVANLGREDELKASGQLNALAGTLARLDPPLVGQRRDVGPLLVVAAVLERLGLAGIVARALPEHRRAELSPAEVVVALVANRLASPSPLYDVAGWASMSALAEVLAVPPMLLDDDRLGRVLDDFAPVAEAVRGAVMLSAVGRFGLDASRLHLDLTALRVAGAYEGSSLVAKGWGACGDGRQVARQVQSLAVTNPQGVPLYMRPEPGDKAELSSIGETFERLAAILPPGLVVCAGSALGRVKDLCQAERAGLGFVVPLRAGTGFKDRFLSEVGKKALRKVDYVARHEEKLRPDQRTRYKGALRTWAVTDPETKEQRHWRVAYIWSSEEERSVADTRARAIAKAEEKLRKVRNGLGGRYYRTKKQVDDKVTTILAPAAKGFITVTTGTRQGKPTLEWAVNADAVAQAAKTDGVYALATNLPGRLGATKVLRTYKDQPLVEWSHRNAKNRKVLRVRPIFLHNDARIEALISVVGLALVVFGLIEIELRRALGEDELLEGLLPEGRAARPTGRNILAAFQGLGITYTANGIVLDRLTRTQRRILELLQVPLPWPEQDA